MKEGRYMGYKRCELIEKMAIVMLSAGLIAYPFNLSYTDAYFTDKASTKTKTRSLNYHSDSMGLSFEVHRFTDLKVRLEISGDQLLATINIPSGYGFSSSDIDIGTIEFDYSSSLSQQIPTRIDTSGTELSMVFNLNEVMSFDDYQVPLSFRITGKGAGKGLSGLGERFVFDGHSELIRPELETFTLPSSSPTPKPVEKVEEVTDEIEESLLEDEEELEEIKEEERQEEEQPEELEEEKKEDEEIIEEIIKEDIKENEM